MCAEAAGAGDAATRADKELLQQAVQRGQQLIRTRLCSALLENDLALVIDERDHCGMVEAALPVRAVGNAERGRKIAHGVVVAVKQRPAARIEAVLVGVSLQFRRRVNGRVERGEDEAHAPRRVLRQMLFDPHHVGDDRRADVLAGRIAHRRHDRLAAEGGEANAHAILRRPFQFEIVERGARRLSGRVHRHVRHVVRASRPGDKGERRSGRGEKQSKSHGASPAQRKARLSAV